MYFCMTSGEFIPSIWQHYIAHAQFVLNPSVTGRCVNQLYFGKRVRKYQRFCRFSCLFIMDSGIHVLNPNMDTIPLDSTITIEDTESETDMVELDSSCDTDIACLDGNPIYDPKNNENSSPIDDIDANNDEVTTHSSRDLQSVSSNDDVRQPIFKVMFRDESVSRYEKLFVYSILCLQCMCENLCSI